MEYPHRGYGSGEEEHHHHPHHPHSFNRPPPQQEYLAYEGERYPHPPQAPDAIYAPPFSHAHTHSPPGPYATHTSSGPFYPHPHDAAPSEVYLSEPAHAAPLLPQGQIVRIFCKGNSSFNLAVEHDSVIMKPANTQDEAQQWIKDSTYGLRVKDNYGHSAFSLVNKKTRKILKHSKEKGQQVLLMDYRPDIKDDDILWSESQDFGEGFKTVRSASDTLLNLTVFEGTKKIRNGSALVLDTWHKGDHQIWKLFPL